MMRAIVWKETREQRLPALILTLLAVPILVVIGPLFDITVGVQAVRVMLAAFFAWACGMVTGAILLANESETGTQALLDILPRWRRQVFAAKTAFGLVVALMQSLVLAITCEIMRPAAEVTPPVFLTLVGIIYAGWLGLNCGLFGSALGKHVLAAVGWSIVALIGPFGMTLGVLQLFVGICSLLMPDLKDGLLLEVPSALLAAPVPLLLAAWIYSGVDSQRRRSARFSELPEHVSGHVRAVWGCRASLWLSFGQGWRFYVGLAMVALVVGPLLLADPVALWPAMSLLIGVVAGIAVVADEQVWGSFRFLAEQRLPLGRLWLWKVGSRAILALAVTLLSLVAAYLAWLFESSVFQGQHGPNWESQLHDSSIDLMRRGMGAQFIFLWAVYGFCFGHLVGLLARKLLVALAIAVVVATAVVAVWLPSLLGGGVPTWQLFGLPLAILLAARLFLWPWATDRLFTRGMVPAWLALVGGTILWPGGSLAYRVLEVPAAGPPFDVAAFKASYPTSKENRGAT